MQHQYKNDYDLGYRMGCGYGEAVSIKNKENWYALAACVLTDLSPDKSMREWGLIETTSYRRSEKGKAKVFSDFIYILNKFCGLKQRNIGNLLGLSQQSVCLAVKMRRNYITAEESRGA